MADRPPLTRRRLIFALLCVLSALFSYSLVFSGEADAWPGFRMPEPVFLLLSAMLFPLALRAQKPGPREWIPGFLFGCFTLSGRAFFDHDWDFFLLRHDLPHLLSYAAALPGFVIAWVLLTQAAFRFLDGHDMPGAGKRASLLDRHPFLTPFLLLCLLHLPSVVLCWPGIACPGDTAWQIRMMYNGTVEGSKVLSNHHPVVHTLLLNGFLRAGIRFSGSAAAGLGCFLILQVLFSLACFSWGLSRLAERGCPAGIRLILTLYLGLCPGISNMLVTFTKDVPYADFLLLFLLACESAVRGENALPALCFSSLGMMLFRSEGKFVCLGALLLLALLLPGRRAKRGMGAAALFLLAASFLYSRAFLSAVRAEPGSLREALSVPFQQTARFFVGHEDEVTEEEREIIDAVLDTGKLTEFYDPNTVDGIKFPSFLISGRQTAAYLLCWARMGMRHPLSYLDAFLELNNLYLYRPQRKEPLMRRRNSYDSANSRYAWNTVRDTIGIDIGYPTALNGAREVFERLRTALMGVPLIRLFCFAATFVWLSIAQAAYFSGKGRRSCALSLLPLLPVLFLFLGPTDGSSFRYAYPLSVLLPFSFFFAFLLREKRAPKSPLEQTARRVYNY